VRTTWDKGHTGVLPVLISVFTSVLASVLTTYVTTRMLRPSPHIKFDAAYPMVDPSESRYSIKVETDTTLKDAFARLLIISKNSDLSDPLNKIYEPRFGWAAGHDSFLPRTIGPVDYVNIAFRVLRDDGQQHIQFFFNQFYGVPGPEADPLPQLNFLNDLNPGTYYMRIALLADGIVPVEQTFKIVWERPTKFELSVYSASAAKQ
jgi:hypothetical protein